MLHHFSPANRLSRTKLAADKVPLLHRFVRQHRAQGLRTSAFWWSVLGDTVLKFADGVAHRDRDSVAESVNHRAERARDGAAPAPGPGIPDARHRAVSSPPRPPSAGRSDIRDLARNGSINFLGSAGGAFCTLLLLALLARREGAVTTGLFFRPWPWSAPEPSSATWARPSP